jgi:hypothetical protein
MLSDRVPEDHTARQFCGHWCRELGAFPLQSKSDVSDFDHLNECRTRVNPSSDGEREQTEHAARLWANYGRSIAALAFWIRVGGSEKASLTTRSTASPVCQVSVSSLSFLAWAM